MSDEMEARLLARVRHQFRSDAIDFAGWEVTGPSSVRVATYRVTDAIVAARMRDRGFRVLGTAPAIAVEPLAEPADDRGIEMFRRLCLLAIVLLVAASWWFSNGGAR